MFLKNDYQRNVDYQGMLNFYQIDYTPEGNTFDPDEVDRLKEAAPFYYTQGIFPLLFRILNNAEFS